MADERHWFLLMYDVRDDKRLRAVHKICKRWGRAVQLSVFRVRGTERELARMEFELSKVLEVEDRLVLVRLCPGCVARIAVKGEPLTAFEMDVPTCKML